MPESEPTLFRRIKQKLFPAKRRLKLLQSEVKQQQLQIEMLRSLLEQQLRKSDSLEYKINDCFDKTVQKIDGVAAQIGQMEQHIKPLEAWPSGHFHSCLPSTEDVRIFLNQFDELKSHSSLPGLELDNQLFFKHIQAMAENIRRYTFPETKEDLFRYYYQNEFYSYGDAISLLTIFLEHKPKRVIEIGSGYSSALMLDIRDKYLDTPLHFTFIEPNPKRLDSLLNETDRSQCTIIRKIVQEVDLGVFNTLEAGDVLFIDSSHVSKLGSDVNHIFFNIIPLLKKGVLIHVHDIFWPFEYIPPWIEEARYWNEAYLLRAMLTNSKALEVLYLSDYAYLQNRSWIEENAPLITKNSGGHIWMKKVT